MTHEENNKTEFLHTIYKITGGEATTAHRHEFNKLLEMYSQLHDERDALLHGSESWRTENDNLKKEIEQLKQKAEQDFDKIEELFDANVNTGYVNSLLKEQIVELNADLDAVPVLRGDDAKRFQEKLENPEPLTPENLERIKKAKELIERIDYTGGMRPSVKWFAKQMEAKLKANDHKGGWKNCSLQYLSMRLTQERKELYGALENRNNGSFFGTSHTDEEIIKECADIANFAMMISDKFGKNFGK